MATPEGYTPPITQALQAGEAAIGAHVTPENAVWDQHTPREGAEPWIIGTTRNLVTQDARGNDVPVMLQQAIGPKRSDNTYPPVRYAVNVPGVTPEQGLTWTAGARDLKDVHAGPVLTKEGEPAPQQIRELPLALSGLRAIREARPYDPTTHGFEKRVTKVGGAVVEQSRLVPLPKPEAPAPAPAPAGRPARRSLFRRT